MPRSVEYHVAHTIAVAGLAAACSAVHLLYGAVGGKEVEGGGECGDGGEDGERGAGCTTHTDNDACT